MTQPTQAQIAAAIAVFQDHYWDSIEYDKALIMDHIKATMPLVLTAAARVWEPMTNGQETPYAAIVRLAKALEDRQLEFERLRAAMQIGRWPPIHVIIERTIKLATIERCAQVADEFLIQMQKDFQPHERLSVTNIVGMLCNLIAAIRKLKDEP